MDENLKSIMIAISKAKTPKMRLNGQQYYKEKNITQWQIKAMKETIDLYKAMGGS